LSRAVYDALTIDDPAPAELITWTLVERFGWTLDYSKSISIQDYHDLIAIDEARHKAGSSKMKK